MITVYHLFNGGSLSRIYWQLPAPLSGYLLYKKVAMYHHMYRAKPKEPTQFGSVSGSEIQNLLFSQSGIVSLYRSEPKEPT